MPRSLLLRAFTARPMYCRPDARARKWQAALGLSFTADEQNPLAGNAGHDDLILWLAYKEARSSIQPAVEPQPEP